MVRLKRRRSDEVIAPFRFDQTDRLRCSRVWPRGGTADNLEKIKNIYPPGHQRHCKIEKPTTGGRCSRLPMLRAANGQFAYGRLLNR